MIDSMDHPARILVVDDEQPLMEAVCEALTQAGYPVEGYVAAEDALAELRTRSFDLLLTDLMMPGMGGIALVRAALRIDSELVCLVMTGHGTIESAVEAMKSGALDYVLKPFKSGVLLPTITRALIIGELRRQKATLANILGERTAELQFANRELQAFAQSVSHDLRAPLDAIAEFSGLLVEKGTALGEARMRQLIERIHANALHMGLVIDDLLKLSRISRTELAWGHVDISAMAGEIVSDLRNAEPARRVHVDIAPGLRAEGDRGLLRIAFENLLGNAWKYTGKRVHANIELGTEPDSQGGPVYFVRDNGAGFDMAHATKLFQPFRRLHSSSEFPGTGVGLSIVSRIVERHGGRIWAEAVEGEGACFRLTLGSAPAPALSARRLPMDGMERSL